MSIPVLLFVLFAVSLIALLAWALRPPKGRVHQSESVFDVLSEPRHCAHLPQILQALQPEDAEFLKQSGATALVHSLRGKRRRIALDYLDKLQEEFELLLEISRALAVMAPEVEPIEEMERWKLSASFALSCSVLRFKLRLGLRPLERLALLSTMATAMVRHLEAVTSKIAEAAVQSAGAPPDPQ